MYELLFEATLNGPPPKPGVAQSERQHACVIGGTLPNPLRCPREPNARQKNAAAIVFSAYRLDGHA
jgi:hypothetical protein